MHLAENLVTTMSPSAIWYSKVTSAKERAAWNSVTDRLYSSRLEPWPGSKLRSVKVGASSSSIVSSSLLTKASRKRRAKALFFSSSEVTEDSLLLDDSRFLCRLDTVHDASQRCPAHRLEVYSPECVEGVFSEVPLRPGPMQEVVLCRAVERCVPHIHKALIIPARIMAPHRSCSPGRGLGRVPCAQRAADRRGS